MMSELPPSIIIGSWHVIRTEPPSSDNPSQECFLHFTPDGIHYWEFPYATGGLPRLRRFDYYMTERGVFISPHKRANGWEVPFYPDGDCLVFSNGPGERRWWLRRIPEHARPECLQHYYEPPAETA